MIYNIQYVKNTWTKTKNHWFCPESDRKNEMKIEGKKYFLQEDNIANESFPNMAALKTFCFLSSQFFNMNVMRPCVLKEEK